MTTPQITSNRLSPVQAKAALALATGATISNTARITGIHRSTIHEWMSDDNFNFALDQAQSDYIDFFRDQLNRIQSKAFSKIESILDDKSTPPAVALRAALAILDRPIAPGPAEENMGNEPKPAENYAENPTASDTIRQLSVIQAVEASVPNEPEPPAQANVQNKPKPGRNEPCPCHSGKKYKRCCLGK
jgi:hypothetical protein